jgi:hypothetical protein
MESESRVLSELKKIKRIIFLTSGLFLLLLLAFYFLYVRNLKFHESKSNEHVFVSDSQQNTSNDSVNLLKLEIYKNRKIEDSLQIRIMGTLDSLELLEGKLRVMQQNSGMTNEVLESVLDSIDLFRAETELLKQEITRINNENLALLHKERLKNSNLQARIKEFEKRLKAIYGINIKITSYFNGHNADSKLAESDKAKKVNEVKVDFELTRDIEPNDVISIHLLKGRTKIKEQKDIKIVDKDRTITSSLDLSQSNLSPGKYKIIIFHSNIEYSIENQSIGESYFDLE